MNRDELIKELKKYNSPFNGMNIGGVADLILSREKVILDAVTAIAKKCDANLSPGRKLAEIKHAALSAIEKMRGEK